MLVHSQKDLVSALRQLHSERPPPDQVQGFLVAVLNGDEPPAVTPVAKGDDEGVYEYFKAHGVFALLKVRSQHAPALRLVKAILTPSPLPSLRCCLWTSTGRTTPRPTWPAFLGHACRTCEQPFNLICAVKLMLFCIPCRHLQQSSM